MAPTNPFLQSPFQTLIDQQEQAKPLPGAQQVKEAQPLPDLSADPVPAKAGTPASAPAAAPATDNLLPPDTLRPLFEATAAHFKVPVNVLMAIAHQESRYRPDAVNPASGAAGIGGYMDATAKSMGINPRDPNEAIPAAAQQIRERLDKGMSIEDAVKEHFAGPDRKKWGDKTAAYGQEVLAKAGAIGQELYGDAADASTEPAKAGTPAPDQDTQQNQFSPTRMGKADYEAEFRKLNPRASDAAVKAAMAQYDTQVAAKTKAAGSRVQDKFKTLQSPEAMFDARLNTRLQGAPDGVAPQLPAREQPQAFPGTTTAHRPGVIDQAKGDFGRGIDNLKALGYGVGGLAADASGYDAKADDLLNHYVAIQNDIAKNNPATIGTYKNVHGLGDAGRYAIEAVMENLPMILPSLVTGGAGAKLAQAGAQRVVGGMIEAQVAKGIAREVAEKNAAQFIARRIMLGSAAGAAPATVGMESGSIMGDIYQDTGKKASGTAIAFGIPAGLLDTLEPVLALRKIAGPAVDEVAGGIIKRLGVEAGKQFITEAGTEGLQTVLEEAAKARAANKNLMTPALLDNVIDSMLKGGIGGAGMGMASQGVAEAKGAIDTPERQIARAIQQNADGIQFAQPASQVALQQLDPNGGAAIDPRDTVRPPVPVAAPAAPAGPLTAAVEAAAPPAFQADDNGFMGQILGDDGQVHTIDSRTGVTMTEAPAAPAGPLEAAIKDAAEQHAANPAPTPALPQEAPQPPALDTLPLEDLRAQLKQVAAAVKANPEQRQELTKQRQAIEKEIGARAKQAKADSKPAEEPLKTGPFEDMAAANNMMLRYAEATGQPHQVVGSEGKFEVKPIGEQGDGINPAGAARGPDGHGRSGQSSDAVGRADAAGSGEAGPGAGGSWRSAGSRPVAGKLPDAGADRAGADGAADAQPALNEPQNAAQNIPKNIPAEPYHKVNPFHAYAFPDEARANAFMDKKSVDREQFEAVQTGPVRWQVKPRAAPVQDAFANHDQEVTADVPESPQVPEEAQAASSTQAAQPADAGSDAAPAAGKDAAPAAAEPVTRDTRNTGVRFHGTSRELPGGKPNNEFAMSGDNRNIYGQGFYTTDAADISEGYMRKGKGGAPTLYEIKERGEPKLYDMEQPMTPETRAMAERAMGDAFPEQDIDGKPISTLRELFDEYRDESQNNGLTRDEVQETFDAIRYNLEQEGYAGYRHIGGLKTKKAPHDVRIYWTPENHIDVEKSELAKYKGDAQAAAKAEQPQPAAVTSPAPTQVESEVVKTPSKPKRKKAAPKTELAAEQDEGVRYSVSGDYSPTFYSALERTLPEMAKVAGKDGTIKPEQARAWLAARQKEGKFKADELQWVGVDDWMQAQPGRVSVADIQNFVRENGVQVEEVTKGDGNADTKYSQYVLPGGENYRELLLTIPDPHRAKFNEEKKALAQSAKEDGFDAVKTGEPWYGPDEWKITNRDGDGAGKSSGATADEALAAWAMLKQGKVKGADYTSSHWDESNIVAHVRFNDRTDADGKRVLFIEELQSDWGQDGLKKGFREQQERQLDELIARRDSLTDEAERSRVQAEINVLGGKAPGVAEGPFVGDTKAWLSLGIKRMIRYAAERGYDRVAFVNGEQSADRYDLSKQVSRIEYSKNPGDDTFSFIVHGLDGAGALVSRERASVDEVANTVGKEIAEKMVANEGQDLGFRGKYERSISGSGLKVGGEGMKAFYDKIVPQTINEVLKKVGGSRAGIVHLDTPQESFAASNHYIGPEHSLDALKDALAVARKGGGNIMENPLTGKREHWAFNRSANEQDLRKLIGLMEAGAPFKEAVLHGDLASPGFAELMGGEYQLLPADQRKVDAQQQTGFDITPELRAKALAGMPLFSVAHPLAAESAREISPLVQALADKGAIVLHADASTLPVKGKAPAGTQALTTADGTIHVVANALGDNARGIILHEAFHAGTKALIGSAAWDGLNTRLGALYRQGERSSGAARAFWDAARARVETAKAKGAVSSGMEHEEFGAYAIEEYAKAPTTVRKWVDDLLGAVKAWALRRFGKQLGDVTPAQLSSLAKLALLDKATSAARERSMQSAPAFSADSSKTIEVDGQRRPIENSRGQLIAPDMHKQMAFWRWAKDTAVVDEQGRPQVVYKGMPHLDWRTDEPVNAIDSPNGPWAGFFTDDAAVASKFAQIMARSGTVVVPAYLRIEHPFTVDAAGKRAGEFQFDNLKPEQRNQAITDAIASGKYDGIIIRNTSDEGNVYVPLCPEQIKSATGNDGSFSGDTPDIRYSVAGAPQPRVLTPDEQGLLRRLQAGVQDGMNRVKQVQQRISEITGVKDLAGADYYGAETNRPGRIAARKEDGRDKLIEPMMRRLAKAGYTQEQLSELLHAQHAEERNEAVARINPEFPDGGSGMKTKEAAQIIARYQNEPKLLALADEARQIARETLDMKRAYGLITDAQYDDLATAYDNYVPLKGDGEYGPKVKRAMGHGEREEHVVENIARDFEQAIVVGEKNQARQSLLQMVLQYPDDGLWTARVPPKGRYVAGTVFEISPVGTRNVEASFTDQAQVAAWMEAKGPAAAGYEVNTSGGQQVVEFTKSLQDNEVMVYVKGSPVRVQVHDEVLARQLRPLHTEMMNTVLGFMQKHNRYLSTIYTGYNPAFILKNATRDAITGSINMTGNHGALTAAKAWAKYPAAWATMLKWAMTKEIPAGAMGDHLREYRAQGGKIGASYMSDLEEQGKTLQRMFDDAKGVSGYAADGKIGKAALIASRKAIGGMAHAVEVLNQAFENSLRLALFAQLREQGAKPGQAAQAAKTVTVNFDRKGTATPYLGAFYLFINPAIQGTANVTSTLARGEHKGQAWALAGMMAAAGFAAAIHGMDDDKDRWLGEKWDTRTKNLRIRVGSHTVNVPMSQEYAPFYAVGVAMGEVRRGQSSLRAAANVLSSFLDAYYPMQGAIQPGSDNYGMDLLMAHVPTVGKMAAQIAANRNSFGNKVVPETDTTRNRPDNLKMYRGTKNSAYDASAQGIAAAGQALGADKYGNDLSKVSPETLKLIWATYTGGLGKFVADSAGLGAMLAQGPGQIEVGDWPVAKDFVKADKMLPLRTRYFDLSKEAQDAIDQFAQAKKMHDAPEMKAIATNPEKGPVLGLAKMVAAVNKIEAVYSDMAVNINADKTLGPADKRARLKDLEDKQEVIYRKAIAAFKK